MVQVISIVLPILLFILAIWFIRINYNSYMINWGKELTFKKILYYGLPVVIKTTGLYVLIIMIHNDFHSDHLLELILFILIYVIVAIFQSAYSIGGFLSRLKYIKSMAINLIKKKTQETEEYVNKIIDDSFMKYSYIIKVIILFAFIVIFIPNITVYVLSNIFYLIVIISLLLFSLALNNIIYFGIISLIIFQFDPIGVSFAETNYIVLASSYLVMMSGMIIETRMDNRMFKIVASRMVKDLNFDLGYSVVYYRKDVTVYQNKTNNYYYMYYRLNGIVTVFESKFDAKLSIFIIKKMIFKGTQYLKQFGEL